MNKYSLLSSWQQCDVFCSCCNDLTDQPKNGNTLHYNEAFTLLDRHDHCVIFILWTLFTITEEMERVKHNGWPVALLNSWHQRIACSTALTVIGTRDSCVVCRWVNRRVISRVQRLLGCSKDQPCAFFFFYGKNLFLTQPSRSLRPAAPLRQVYSVAGGGVTGEVRADVWWLN